MRKLILGVIALAAASVAATTTSERSEAGVIAPWGVREAGASPYPNGPVHPGRPAFLLVQCRMAKRRVVLVRL